MVANDSVSYEFEEFKKCFNSSFNRGVQGVALTSCTFNRQLWEQVNEHRQSVYMQTFNVPDELLNGVWPAPPVAQVVRPVVPIVRAPPRIYVPLVSLRQVDEFIRAGQITTLAQLFSQDGFLDEIQRSGLRLTVAHSTDPDAVSPPPAADKEKAWWIREVGVRAHPNINYIKLLDETELTTFMTISAIVTVCRVLNCRPDASMNKPGYINHLKRHIPLTLNLVGCGVNGQQFVATRSTPLSVVKAKVSDMLYEIDGAGAAGVGRLHQYTSLGQVLNIGDGGTMSITSIVPNLDCLSNIYVFYL